jgi:cephalosporin hydroxylase
MFPPLVEIDLNESVGEYWRARLAQHTKDSYLGVRMLKFPEDLRVYEHLLWESAASVVIELGTNYGGSALWFADRLEAIARQGRIHDPVVISVDRDLTNAHHALDGVDWSGVTLIEGDVADPDLPDEIAEHVPKDAVCLVVEDTAHDMDTTLAALRGFARFVRPGGYFVVEDGCVDVEELRVSRRWPRGVSRAIAEFLSSDEGREFVLRRDLERYGLTCHIGGFLQRRGHESRKTRLSRALNPRSG